MSYVFKTYYRVEEKEIFVETELNSMVKEFEDTVSKNKMGLQEFTQNLDKFIAEQQTKTTNLKKIFNKFESNSSAGAPKERKTKDKRKKDKENKE